MKRLKKALEKFNKLIDQAKVDVEKEIKHDKSYSNMGDSCSYHDDFEKKQTKLSKRAANSIAEALTYSLRELDIKTVKCSSDEMTVFTDIANSLKKLAKIKKIFLKNFRKGNPYAKQFKQIKKRD